MTYRDCRFLGPGHLRERRGSHPTSAGDSLLTPERVVGHVASAAAIDCCSCRHHERSRRCRRLNAAPVSRSAVCLPLGFDLKIVHELESNAWWWWWIGHC